MKNINIFAPEKKKYMNLIDYKIEEYKMSKKRHNCGYHNSNYE